jgi:hypothetical protein
MVILAYDLLIRNTKARKWIFRLSLLSLVILIYARIGLIYQPLLPIVYETHGNKTWVAALEKHVGTIPVVFENSYRRAPMYAFYSGNTSFSLNNIYYRLNQYSIDSSEALIQNQKVAYISKYAKSGNFEYKMPNGDLFYGRFIDDFESYRNLRCYIEEDAITLNEEKQLLKIYNPYNKDIALSKIKLKAGYLNAYKQLNEVVPLTYKNINGNITALKAQDTSYFYVTMPKPTKEYPIYLKFAISENDLLPGINSNSIKVIK